MKKTLLSLLLALVLALTACGGNSGTPSDSSAPAAGGSTLVYGSGDYTRINPAMDEHGEINILLFNGLTAHDGKNQVVPSLARSWEFDESTYTYTFHLEEIGRASCRERV